MNVGITLLPWQLSIRCLFNNTIEHFIFEDKGDFTTGMDLTRCTEKKDKNPSW